ncbi:helix-turn-helix domain-containing protein [Kribbella jejuensis]|jgi:transposase-like protein|uniref:Helix-turn-helix protein n=1 Tax=Kribbella jejuensis TaxID=236068 RepID=A0A542DAV4_9ACTN|nr:helix-turn-helix domain-containing protein [Kribbella jejuensis]TQJ00201.1 helix-turn-helix protein [Kribbella jejuensis]
MDGRSSLSVGQRERAVAWFEEGLGYRSVAGLLGVAVWPVKRLYRRWQVWGRGALVTKPTKRSYSFEFKLAVVKRFLAGESATVLAAEYELSAPELVKTWARTYRREGADGLRPKPKGRPPKAAKDPDAPVRPESELEQLRREVERLRAENAYLGKVRALRDQERR